MTKHRVVVYSKDDCPRCEELIDDLKKRGLDPEIRRVESLTDGTELNPKAVAQLSRQNFSTPLVSVDGVFVEPEKALQTLG